MKICWKAAYSPCGS